MKAVILIQKVVRGKIARKNLARKAAELRKFKESRNMMATRIQSAYRGYRGYLKSKIVMLDMRKIREHKASKATKINNFVRCFLSRARRRNLTDARMKKWLHDARMWRETWSDESSAWYYIHTANHEALWEPPPDGYTKADGKLVLANGAIMDDPKNKKKNIYGEDEEDEEEETKKKKEKFCCECTERVAIRACNECGDKFCTPCYKETHAMGTRRLHT